MLSFHRILVDARNGKQCKCDTLAIFAGLSATPKCLLGGLPKPGFWDPSAQTPLCSLRDKMSQNSPAPLRLLSPQSRRLCGGPSVQRIVCVMAAYAAVPYVLYSIAILFLIYLLVNHKSVRC